MPGEVLRVGIDLVRIQHVAESLTRFGSRYTERLFTAGEIAYCSTAEPERQAERYAARFAAKEATVKALRPTGTWFDWKSIEVARHPEGWCELVLHGAALALAVNQGTTRFAVSLSHDADYATAVVVAQ